MIDHPNALRLTLESILRLDFNSRWGSSLVFSNVARLGRFELACAGRIGLGKWNWLGRVELAWASGIGLGG